MKNLITTFVCALALSTTVTFANTNDETKAESKMVLPASNPAIETPAPQSTKLVNEYTKYTPAQKAAIVELSVIENEAADSKITLPTSNPVIETPAPQTSKTVNEYVKYTPAQKAAIVELKVAK